MDKNQYIHEIVLKVIDNLKLCEEHYQLEYVAAGKIYQGQQMYITVFFQTNSERNDAFADGISNKIDRTFLELAKEYDKKKLITGGCKYIYYDSFENLKKNYNGQMAMYFAEEHIRE